MKLRNATFLTLLLFAALFSCSKDEAPPGEEGPNPEEVLEIITNQEVTLNPSGYSPLSARIDLETTEPVSVRMRVVGKKGTASDVVQDFPNAGTSFSIPVHGLYAESDNRVELSFTGQSGSDLGTQAYSITTGALLAAMPQVFVDIAEPGIAPGMTLVSYFGHSGNEFPQRPFIFDRFGDIRWYLDYRNHPQLNQLFYDDGIGRLANGNFFFGSGGGAFGAAATNAIYEVDLFGTVVDSWELPGYGFHHEVFEKPDGNFIVTVNKTGEPTIEDYIIEIDRETKEIIREWDLNVSLENTRTTWTDDSQDWFHANALFYDSTDDTIVVSGRTQGVVKLTAANEVVWILAPHKDWGLSGRGEDLNQFLLQPLDANGSPITAQAVLDGDSNHPDFEWPWYQHAPELMPNGDILLFDNGDNRNYTGAEVYSRAVSYRIDAGARTIQQQWQYGKEYGAGYYSRIVSDTDFLAAQNHVIFAPGATTFNGLVYGKSLEIDVGSGEILFEATIIAPITFFNITFHRTERISLYP